MQCESCRRPHEGSYGSGRFCSVSCARCFATKNSRTEINKKVSDTLKGRSNPNKGKIVGSIKKRSYDSLGKYWTKKNLEKRMEEKRLFELWLIGEYEWPVNLTRNLRNLLIEKNGPICSECGWSRVNPKTNKVPIQFEHKDGNYTNNRSENVCLLCPNCHSLTPTYGSLNRGFGRNSRTNGV